MTTKGAHSKCRQCPTRATSALVNSAEHAFLVARVCAMMSTMTTANWARLGAALVAAREELGLQQQEVAQRIGVKRGALANIEHGRIAKVTTTLRAYARLVGWTDDSLEVVLAGGEPIARQDAHQESTPFGASPEEPSDLSLAVQAALEEGPLVDSQVVTVPTSGGHLTATIVVRGESDASPEELHEALLEWRRRRSGALRYLEE